MKNESTTLANSKTNDNFLTQNYIFPVLIFLFIAYKLFKNFKNKKLIPELIKKGAVVVDVRSEGEFKGGHNPNSVNIPLDQLNVRFVELNKDQFIILCCASGIRSGTAQGILKSKGFKNLYNAGSWSSTIS